MVETPGGAHFTSCVPDYGRDEAFQARYAAAAADPADWQRFRAEYLAGDEASYQQAVRGRGPRAGRPRPHDRRRPAARPSRAEVCVVACAEAWRGDGAILASPMGLIPTLGARLAQLTLRPRPAAHRRRGPSPGTGTGADGTGRVAEGWLPYRSVFTMVAAGLRHVMMGAAQIDRFGNQNISCIGDWARPKAQLLGVRGAPGNTINHPVSYWVPRHSRRVFVERVDMVSGIGYDRAAGLGPRAARFHELRVVVTNLAVLDFQAAGPRACGSARSTRASRPATSSPPPASRWPCRARCRSPGCPPPRSWP